MDKSKAKELFIASAKGILIVGFGNQALRKAKGKFNTKISLFMKVLSREIKKTDGAKWFMNLKTSMRGNG